MAYSIPHGGPVAVRAAKALISLLSYLFHLLLSLLLLLLAGIALLSDTHSLRLNMLPWKDEQLAWWLFGSATFGIISVILAIRGKLRFLFVLWSLAVAVMLVRGYFLSPYVFEAGEFRIAVYLTGAAILAVFGAWFQFRRLPAKRRGHAF
jgi:hypothetical protein